MTNHSMIFEYDEEDKVWYVSFPALPGCLAHGETQEEALRVALEVKMDWLEVTKETGWDIDSLEDKNKEVLNGYCWAKNCSYRKNHREIK